jgi:NAD-dependent deacetylase
MEKTDLKQFHKLFDEVDPDSARITVLTGAGISAESGIPTFRGPEGYWTVGSKVYQPQQMATYRMFRQNPEAVWQWYLYRLGVCQSAKPNPGHYALVDLESLLQKRFTLITQNVDNLHLVAGQTLERTFQIHGNIFFVRCSAGCHGTVYPLPHGVAAKEKGEPLSAIERDLLHCPKCRQRLRPHVLWFDETYNEHHYHLQSAIAAARRTTLLLVVGTSGATNLPNQVVAEVIRNKGCLIDINIEPNPFGQLARQYPKGLAIQHPSAAALQRLVGDIDRRSRGLDR